MAEEDQKEPVLNTPELILKDAVLISDRLDMEAQEALSWGGGDAVTCRQKLEKRARLIVELPDRVREAMKKGQSFPEGELGELDNLAELANRALKDGRPFALGAFLKPRGSLEGEPNLLEELVNELYPPKP